jgi:Ca2+:H+ antiporter
LLLTESVAIAAEAFGMTPALVGFVIVALVGGAAEMASAFSGARQNRLDLSIGIALGSASQIALFVAPACPHQLRHRTVPNGPATLAGSGGHDADRHPDRLHRRERGRSAWFIGVLVLNVYLVFATALYLLPPKLP